MTELIPSLELVADRPRICLAIMASNGEWCVGVAAKPRPCLWSASTCKCQTALLTTITVEPTEHCNSYQGLQHPAAISILSDCQWCSVECCQRVFKGAAGILAVRNNLCGTSAIIACSNKAGRAESGGMLCYAVCCTSLGCYNHKATITTQMQHSIPSLMEHSSQQATAAG